MPSPNDHLRMLVELLRPAGPELGRRWLAALLLAPASEREAVVEAVERRMSEEYGGGAALTLSEPPVQRQGHVEQVVRSYRRAKAKAADPQPNRSAG